MEIAIPWGSEYSPKADVKITVACGINDDTDKDGSTREGHTFSGTGLGSSWSPAPLFQKLLYIQEKALRMRAFLN